jgi:hypothetical protein
VKISKDGGAAANVTNLPTAITMGNTVLWDFSLTATELQAAKIRITVSDSATKAVEDVSFEIDTYGNASAQHAADLSDAVRLGLTALPNAAAEAAGGLYTRGTGAGQVNQPANGMIDSNVVRNAGTAITAAAGVQEVKVQSLTANAITAAGIAADVTTELRALASGTSDSGTTTTMVDAARTEADTDYWKGCFILFTSGNIAGQCRLITGFNAATDTITYAPATTQAAATQTYEILPAGRVDLQLWLGTVVNALLTGLVQASVQDITSSVISAASFTTDSGLKPVRSGICQASSSSSITLDASASSVDDFYKGTRIYLVSGGGAGQSRLCTAYNGTTKVATTEPNWITNPTGASTNFAVLEDASTPAIGTSGIVAASFAAGAVNAAVLASDAITAAKVADGTIDAATFAAGAINAAAIANGAIDAATMAADMNSYTAKVWVTKNGTTSDIYSITFYKNGQPIESGITSPLIDYVKRDDGTILVNDATPTEQSNGDYFYTESTNKITAGRAYMSRVTATIDGATQVMKQNVSRDST